MRATVDRSRCQGHALCVLNVPELFDLDDVDSHAYVLSDPVPAGATVLGSGLGRDSAIAAAGAQPQGAALLAFEERRAEWLIWVNISIPVAEWRL